MATWSEFAAAAPALAEHARRLFYRTETGEALLVTVRGDDLPRVHPIYLAVMEDRLVAFITPSPKAIDLEEDGRYALHNHQDPNAPDEIQLRGRARDDRRRRDPRPVRRGMVLHDHRRVPPVRVPHRAGAARRARPDDWPPRYTSWTDDGADWPRRQLSRAVRRPQVEQQLGQLERVGRPVVRVAVVEQDVGVACLAAISRTRGAQSVSSSRSYR